MIKAVLLLTGLITLQNISITQVNESKNYLYLFSDSIIYGNVIEYNTSNTDNPYFLVDSNKFEEEQVKFYKNETGFFVNTFNIDYRRSSPFSKRMLHGRINYYKGKSRNYGSDFETTSSHLKNYYNRQFEDLKIANYKMLKHELADSPESMSYLQRHKTATIIQTAFYIVGGTTMLIGILNLVKYFRTKSSKNSNEINYIPKDGYVEIAIGAGFLSGSYFISLSKPKLLKAAIDKYNN